MRISDWSSDVCSSDLTTFKSVDPVKRGGIVPNAHIALYQGVTNVRIGNLIVRSKKPSPLFIMDSDTPSNVVVDSIAIKTPRGTPLVGGKHPALIHNLWKTETPTLYRTSGKKEK